MAYDRSAIRPKTAEVLRKLSEDGRQQTVGDIVRAVVYPRMCGGGVAQQIVAKWRKTGAMGPEGIGEVATPTEPDDIDNLLLSLDELRQRVDEGARNAELHTQVLRLLGALNGPTETTAAA